MWKPAKAFLFHSVPDTVHVHHTALDALPEPAYIVELRRLLVNAGIEYLHMLFYENTIKVQPKWLRYRLYGVASFVWRGRVFIIRHNFRRADFAQWPSDLKAIWQNTRITVPDQVDQLP
jgi:hypothetical protein